MLTIFEKINNYCEMGFYPIVSDGENYIIVSPTKDEYGDWRVSYLCDSLEGAIKYISDRKPSFSKEDWNRKAEEGWKIIGSYPIKIKRFKLGDKVRVRKNLKDLQYGGDYEIYNEEYESTAGMVGEITGVGSCSYTIYFDSLEDCFNYSHDQVEPYIEEFANKKTINIGGKNYKVTPELLEALKNLKEIE